MVKLTKSSLLGVWLPSEGRHAICCTFGPMTKRCEDCEWRKQACPAPPPDTRIPWGHAEFMQLGDYWMHLSSVDPMRLSYGSALAAYKSATAKASSLVEVTAARTSYLLAWRSSMGTSQEGMDHAMKVPVNGCNCLACAATRPARPVDRKLIERIAASTVGREIPALRSLCARLLTDGADEDSWRSLQWLITEDAYPGLAACEAQPERDG
jgi:hypothetical protein